MEHELNPILSDTKVCIRSLDFKNFISVAPLWMFIEFYLLPLEHICLSGPNTMMSQREQTNLMSAECPDAQIPSGYYRGQVQTIEHVQKCKLLFILNE